MDAVHRVRLTSGVVFGLVLELRLAGLLAEAGLEELRDGAVVVEAVRRGSGGWVEAVEDEQVTFGVVHGGEGGDTLEVIEGGECVHLVVLDLIPGDVPAGVVGLDAVGQFHGAKVVADRGQAGHQGKVRA